MKSTTLLIAVSTIASFATPALAIPDTHEEVLESAEVFQEFVHHNQVKIPQALVDQSSAIAIITNVKEGGFIFGGRRGDGVIVSRMADGRWSNPAFINLTGGSVGLQAGFQSSDLILFFPSQAALDQVLSGDFELGGSVSGTAGPIGETVEESLEGFDRNNVYVYSKSNGLFGGVTLEGSELDFDTEDNRNFYGRMITPRDILTNDEGQAPVVVNSLKAVLTQAK